MPNEPIDTKQPEWWGNQAMEFRRIASEIKKQLSEDDPYKDAKNLITYYGNTAAMHCMAIAESLLRIKQEASEK